jgi:creatinine amidohydrolase
VSRAVEALQSRPHRDVTLFQPRWEGDPHAGHHETALLLALDPERVRMDRAVSGDTRPLAMLMPQLTAHGVRAVSETGVLGDPTAATAAQGIALLDDLAAQLIGHVTTWRSG